MIQPMSNEIRKTIKRYIKNRIDISNIIKGISIKGEDLSYAIITDFNRSSEDMHGIRLSKAVIGKEGKVTTICGNNLRGSFFDDVQFLGHTLFRRNDCRDSDFGGALAHNMEYQYSDFRGCRFCEVSIRIGTSYSANAKFSPEFFKDLGDMWNLNITVKE